MLKRITNSYIKYVVVGFLLLSLTSCSKREEAEPAAKKNTDLDTIPVQVSKVELKEIVLTKSFSGTLEGEEQANIVAKLPERIVSIKVKVGEPVKAGQLIILLDKAGATSQYYQAEAAYLNAKKDLDRMEALYKEGAISQQLLDGTRTGFSIAKANFEAVKSSVELTSPISGIVTAVNANIGDLAAVGMPLVTVANINSMKIILNVGEVDLAHFSIGQPIKVYSEIKPGTIMNGKISQSAKSAEVESRTFEVKGIFPNTSDKWFKPGMFCTADVELKSQKGSLSVPSRAITITEKGSGVFTIENNRAYFKLVTQGISNDTFTEVLSGLKEGEVIVTVGMNNLKEGSLVHF
ncbi:MAG: efflux RND transporter periplasmic adaptor subunit [Ignavibacteriaceae bacterium]|nr:efflux RND transporter periplasmic adaptor subunit [Ignavibacteriaceae bacterium]